MIGAIWVWLIDRSRPAMIFTFFFFTLILLISNPTFIFSLSFYHLFLSFFSAEPPFLFFVCNCSSLDISNIDCIRTLILSLHIIYRALSHSRLSCPSLPPRCHYCAFPLSHRLPPVLFHSFLPITFEFSPTSSILLASSAISFYTARSPFAPCTHVVSYSYLPLGLLALSSRLSAWIVSLHS